MTTLILGEVRQNLVQLVLDQLKASTACWTGQKTPLSLDPDVIEALRDDLSDPTILDEVSDAIRAASSMPIWCQFEFEANEQGGTLFYYAGYIGR